MDSIKLLRRILILLTVAIILAVFLLVFQLTDLSFRAYDRLQETSPILIGAYLIMVSVIAFAGLYLIVKIWTMGRRKRKKGDESVIKRRNLDDVRARLEKAQKQGLDVSQIRAELEYMQGEEVPKELEVAFFGKISTGKSSLIRTLIPNAHIETSIIGGSTANIERFYYTTSNDLSLTLIDMPGTHQAQTVASLDNSVMTAARRVHIVCYVLDQDITASDKESIDLLRQFGKPLVVVLNKINRYNENERKQLREHIRANIPADVELVLVSSAYPQSIHRVLKDGSVRMGERLSGGEIRPLLQLFVALEDRRGELGNGQKQSLIDLADDALSQRLEKFRHERSEAMVKAYSRKAMLGGVAAVGPGTDVLIQGYLGMDMVKSLTKLYEVSTQDIDLHTLMEMVGGKVKSQITMILALTGNVCKAFPGIGTVLGGASHAIAYGLIFESLGQALIATLEDSEQNFTAQTVVHNFEQQMQQDLEKRAISLVKAALQGKEDE